MNFVEPTPSAKASGGWFESLSWENVDKYEADVIILDNRTSTLQPADLTEADLEEAARRQGRPGHRPRPRADLSYAKCAPLLEDLAEAIEKAKKVS